MVAIKTGLPVKVEETREYNVWVCVMVQLVAISTVGMPVKVCLYTVWVCVLLQPVVISTVGMPVKVGVYTVWVCDVGAGGYIDSRNASEGWGV